MYYVFRFCVSSFLVSILCVFKCCLSCVIDPVLFCAHVWYLLCWLIRFHFVRLYDVFILCLYAICFYFVCLHSFFIVRLITFLLCISITRFDFAFLYFFLFRMCLDVVYRVYNWPCSLLCSCLIFIVLINSFSFCAYVWFVYFVFVCHFVFRASSFFFIVRLITLLLCVYVLRVSMLRFCIPFFYFVLIDVSVSCSMYWVSLLCLLIRFLVVYLYVVLFCVSILCLCIFPI